MTESVLLALLALLPALALMIYIYKKDKIEKEPIGLLLGLFGLGCLSVIPAVILELLAGGILSATGIPADTVLYKFLEYFFGVALVEEGCKLFFTYIVTRRNKNFSCVFDGVVYSVFVSLGFAAAENLMYVFQNGIEVAMVRMVTSIPGHCFFGVIMGYFYSRWFLNKKAKQLENHLYYFGIAGRKSESFKPGYWMWMTLLAPTLVHGFYDFSLALDSVLSILIFYVFLTVLYIFCFGSVRKMSKQDSYISYFYMDMVLKKHPEATQYLSMLPEFAPFFGLQPVMQPLGPQPPMQPPQYPQPQYPQQNVQPPSPMGDRRQ